MKRELPYGIDPRRVHDAVVKPVGPSKEFPTSAKVTVQDFLAGSRPEIANRRGPNRTELAYDKHLSLLLHAGEILWFKYEAMKLKLAPDTTYTPDFIVVTPRGVEAHEVKGFERDDAAAKFKIAADIFCWMTFITVKKDGEGWRETRRINAR